MYEVILETLLDSVKMLPFLFAAYLIIEYMEHNASEHLKDMLVGSGKFGAIGGAILGVVPQCGFSVAAANFYAGRIITRGTLIAVFLTTSDEAIPVILSEPGSARVLLPLIGMKLVIGMAAGLLLDWSDRLRGLKNREVKVEEHSGLCEHCHCDEHGVVQSALRHTVMIFLFILAVAFVLNLGFFFLGEETVSKLLMSDTVFQPMITGLFGLIPNCAASVILTQLYLSGGISFGSVLAGLSTGAGVGLAVLFRVNPDKRDSFKLLIMLYVGGTACGILCQTLGISI